jgi:RNA polymerase sigma-70 factor (ECF subfamily)
VSTPVSFSDQVRECAKHLAEVGDPGLAGLYNLTAMRLVRLATSVTRHQQDAEDAVQTVLVRVAAQPHKLNSADQPWYYLLRMVRNQSLLILRQRKTTVALDTLSDLSTQVMVDQAEQAESFRAVWLALRQLPVQQREVVVLKIWETLTFAEIGQVLDISASTAASRYRYALEKLAKRLGNNANADQRPFKSVHRGASGE